MDYKYTLDFSPYGNEVAPTTVENSITPGNSNQKFLSNQFDSVSNYIAQNLTFGNNFIQSYNDDYAFTENYGYTKTGKPINSLSFSPPRYNAMLSSMGDGSMNNGIERRDQYNYYCGFIAGFQLFSMWFTSGFLGGRFL